MNKYQIGDLVETKTDNGIKVGRIYEIKAITKRYGATTQKEGFSVIVETACLGYRILGYQNRIREVDIIRILPDNMVN